MEAFNFSADGEHNFSNNFIPRPTVKEEPRDGDQEDMATISADSEDIKPVVVKKERDSESGESSVSHPTVKLGRKRSAAIAALKTPIMKQQRYKLRERKGKKITDDFDSNLSTGCSETQPKRQLPLSTEFSRPLLGTTQSQPRHQSTLGT